MWRNIVLGLVLIAFGAGMFLLGIRVGRDEVPTAAAQSPVVIHVDAPTVPTPPPDPNWERRHNAEVLEAYRRREHAGWWREYDRKNCLNWALIDIRTGEVRQVSDDFGQKIARQDPDIFRYTCMDGLPGWPRND